MATPSGKRFATSLQALRTVFSLFLRAQVLGEEDTQVAQGIDGAVHDRDDFHATTLAGEGWPHPRGEVLEDLGLDLSRCDIGGDAHEHINHDRLRRRNVLLALVAHGFDFAEVDDGAPAKVIILVLDLDDEPVCKNRRRY
ncbi:hypothetical protein MRB53_038139 [Persea americana]|nr:hypothetical protein MRB53_038139 [Persea americana]